MPFVFSEVATRTLADDQRLIEDRRNNPVRGRSTKFRLMQQNMLAYTYGTFIPGFGPPAINSRPIEDLVSQPTENARSEGDLFYGRDFTLSTGQVGKVEGDIFEILEAATLWGTAARWNAYMAGFNWPSAPRYTRPRIRREERKQIAVLNLPREYDWIRLLTPTAQQRVADLRSDLAVSELSLPTSTPDIIIARRPNGTDLSTADAVDELENLSLRGQGQLSTAHTRFEGLLEPSDLLLAIALKKSLRSDRLYQPLYEANVMHLLLESFLGSDSHLDFEVHTLESAGTRAIDTYRAATLAHVAAGHSSPMRAVAELYEPTSSSDLVRRFLAYLEVRFR